MSEPGPVAGGHPVMPGAAPSPGRRWRNPDAIDVLPMEHGALPPVTREPVPARMDARVVAFLRYAFGADSGPIKVTDQVKGTSAGSSRA
jgi:hypothetical protein